MLRDLQEQTEGPGDRKRAAPTACSAQSAGLLQWPGKGGSPREGLQSDTKLISQDPDAEMKE